MDPWWDGSRALQKRLRLEHADQAAASPDEIAQVLARALARDRFDRDRLREMAKRYGSRATYALVEGALREERIVSFVHENAEEFADLVQIVSGERGLRRSIVESQAR